MWKDGNAYVVQSVEPGLLWIAPLHSIPKFIAFGYVLDFVSFSQVCCGKEKTAGFCSLRWHHRHHCHEVVETTRAGTTDMSRDACEELTGAWDGLAVGNARLGSSSRRHSNPHRVGS